MLDDFKSDEENQDEFERPTTQDFSNEDESQSNNFHSDYNTDGVNNQTEQNYSSSDNFSENSEPGNQHYGDNSAYQPNQSFGSQNYGQTRQGGYNAGNYYYQGSNQTNNQNGSFRPYDFSGNQNYQPNIPNQPKKSSAGKKVAVCLIVFAVIIGLFAAISSLFAGDNSISEIPPENSQTAPSGETQPSQAIQGGQSSVITTNSQKNEQLSAVEIAKKVRPSVVGVMSYTNGQLSGEGSGVVMGRDATGKYSYVITCDHVINKKGDTFRILTLDGKTFEAKMVATDLRTDIGVLQVESSDLPVAQFGDSSSLEVGETVYAIGNPGGSEYFGSITDGIISAIDRSVSGSYTMTCIQHNAAINPGNSGGALVNSAGQVIGINSSKIAATDFEGMGFAVPMSIVKPVVDNLVKYGYVPNRPKLGIQYASVSSYQLYSMVVAIKGLPSGSLVIAGINEDSSLVGTDAQVGDLIIAVNGKKMDTSDVLLDIINTGSVGDKITLTLCRVESRTYKTTTFDVTLTLIEDRGSKSEPQTTTAPSSDGYYYGGASSFEDFFKDYFGN